MRVFGKTDVGRVRKVNQDFIYYSRVPVGAFPNLFIVADGMGGHNAGDFASRYAVECFLDYIQTSKPDALIRMVDEGVKYANKKIIEKSMENPSLRGMGNSTAPMIIMLSCFVGFRQIYLFVVSNYISSSIISVTSATMPFATSCTCLTPFFIA